MRCESGRLNGGDVAGDGGLPAPAAHPLIGLVRRFALDWLGRADPGVCAEIMHPDYSIHIGGHTLEGREDAYVRGTLAQLRRFPGLLLTAHELFTDGECVALRFTEHGPSAADDMTPAAWTGIGLFWWNGSVLTRNVTEEDYHSRRRQLAERVSDPVDHPAPAPWAVTPRAPDPVAEKAVREWLGAGDLGHGGTVLLDDGWAGHPTPALLDVTGTEVRELFSAGERVGFRVTQSGNYRGGLPGTEGREGRASSFSAVGMVAVGANGGISGHVIRDRVGLRRAVRS
jgi:SnoaL-like domain